MQSVSLVRYRSTLTGTVLLAQALGHLALKGFISRKDHAGMRRCVGTQSWCPFDSMFALREYAQRLGHPCFLAEAESKSTHVLATFIYEVQDSEFLLAYAGSW